MPIGVTEASSANMLETSEAPGLASVELKGSAVAEEFSRETLGVTHPGHLATMELDSEYFLALKNYYSTWTISRKDTAISRAVKEFVITGILLTQNNLNGARVHIRRALLAGATPREMFQAITVAAIPGGVPVVWQGAPILKSEMDNLGLGMDDHYQGGEHV
jgi:alkylhydroperoxidase/carboxymuconolactone decarboxylase family protein YurZ